ncbi:zinc knuckle (CCHC-type) family protein [Striga asiatica]|uniref:Zinc knuckle (CCHC-type) family protein n=1 Tax=Striga asiatica TaxID=4170 RepID=A0A5A7PH18_STRAF|nr:zinc knuckle (CCHC-type) family protein [Striga asiatica]
MNIDSENYYESSKGAYTFRASPMLVNLCFYCGKIGHLDKACAKRLADIDKSCVMEGQYGEWLRAPENGGFSRSNYSSSPSRQNTNSPQQDKNGYQGSSSKINVASGSGKVAGVEETGEAQLSSQSKLKNMQIIGQSSSSQEVHNTSSKQIVSIMASHDEEHNHQQIVCIGQHTEPDLPMLDVQQDTHKSSQISTQPSSSSQPTTSKVKGWKRSKIQDGRLLRSNSQTDNGSNQESHKRSRALMCVPAQFSEEEDGLLLIPLVLVEVLFFLGTVLRVSFRLFIILFALKFKSDWLIGGDWNAIVDISEKRRGKDKILADMISFQNFINQMSMVEWSSSHSSAMVLNCYKTASDHSLMVLVSELTQRKSKARFIFNKQWVEKQDVMAVVKKAWEPLCSGTPMFQFQEKIKQTRVALLK